MNLFQYQTFTKLRLEFHLYNSRFPIIQFTGGVFEILSKKGLFELQLMGMP